jgi:hypothetical protein
VLAGLAETGYHTAAIGGLERPATRLLGRGAAM